VTSTEMDIDASVCSVCGMGVHMNEEGSVTCDGCNEPTDRCKCEPQTTPPMT